MRDWGKYFMDIADKVSELADCNRRHVGAVIVRDRRILATGFNGAMAGADHCDDVGHMMENDHCIRTVHAEVNAVVQCARQGISCDGAIMYVNTLPCWNCIKTVVNAGIRIIRFKDIYKPEIHMDKINYARGFGVSIEQL